MNSDAEIKSGIIRQCMDEVYTAEQYAKDHARMCKRYGCRGCPIGKAMIRKSDIYVLYGIDFCDCVTYANMKPREVIAITRKWAEEHPESATE